MMAHHLRRPLFWAGRAPLSWRDCLFCATAGLRGSVSLILAQAVVTEVPSSVDSTVLVRRASLYSAAAPHDPQI